MKKIGLTSTIPVEIIFASGNIPVDLNNIFITSDRPEQLILEAEKKGLSPNLCGWIKGIYPLSSKVDELIVAETGDCAEILALGDIWKSEGKNIYTFRYPYNRNYEEMKNSIEAMMRHFGTTRKKVNTVKIELDKIRKKLHLIDQLTWKEGIVTGYENHLYLVQSSDFKGNYKKYGKDIETFLESAYARETKTSKNTIRLAFVGVPPIITDFYQVIESYGAQVVYNEVQHQFSMPYFISDIVEQYLRYTYPYETLFRLNTIKKEFKKRKVDGVILYVESFCYKNLQNTLFRRIIDLPFIELEGTEPGPMDMRTRMRIESFIQMLQMEKGIL